MFFSCMDIRLDTFLANIGLIPRRQSTKALKTGIVWVDGREATKGEMKLSLGQEVTYFGVMPDGSMPEDGVKIEVKDTMYLLLHKPAWYVCSELDEGGHLSYKNLLVDCPYAAMLHAAGRLDQDTEWVVVCSNDGQWIHQIISPKKHLEKEYFVRTRDAITQEAIDDLCAGVVFGPAYPGGQRDEGYCTMPAQATRVTMDGTPCLRDDANVDTHAFRLTIVEGKFHQVKRMLQAVGNEVVYLRRDRVGKWELGDVESGKWMYIEA
jgi:16S rRNA pseudouridine516 synthase